MCGIFAYVGEDTHAALKALQGLKDLEYRGYDSWGIAVQAPSGAIQYKKAVGKISAINADNFKRMRGSTVLGHTRWATHGKVTQVNAHPHLSEDKKVVVVHNGIIENYQELKQELQKKLGNDVFRSETDTEVIPHLIDFYLKKNFSFEEAFIKTCRKLSGRFAFVALHAGAPYILAARNGSPLVVGVGKDEYFLASDTPAFLDYTSVVHFMDDREYAKIERGGISFWNFDTGKKVQKKTQKISWEKSHASRGGFDHFMMKEIMDQKETISQALLQDRVALKNAGNLLKRASHIIFSGAGTAGHMCMEGEYLFSEIAKKETHFIPAAEIHKALPFVNSKSVLVAVTQSGETADLLEAIHEVKEKRGRVLGVLNVRGSSVERESHSFLPINAGPEKAVASTKAASAQLAALMLLAFECAGNSAHGKKILAAEIKKINSWLTPALLAHIKQIARRIVKARSLFIIGKGVQYPIALEGALKIKEVSYIHAEGFAGGELKHGPIALIEKGTPCVALVSNDTFKHDMISSSEELKARGGYIVGVAPEKNKVFDVWIQVPDLSIMAPMASMIATQILAYHLAVLLGHDPDKPRNLAKSVTVK